MAETVVRNYLSCLQIRQEKVFVNNRTYLFTVYKQVFNERKFCASDICLFLDKIILPKELDEWDLNYEARADMDILNYGSFTEKLPAKMIEIALGDRKVMPITMMERVKLIGAQVTDKKILLREEITSFLEFAFVRKMIMEKFSVSTPMCSFKAMKDIIQALDDTVIDRNSMICATVGEILDNLHRKYARVERTKEADDMTSLKSMVSNEKRVLSMSFLDRYFWNRHNVFAREIMIEFSIGDPSKDTDVSSYEEFLYFGEDSHLTPDMFLEMNSKIYILDFFITDGLSRIVADEKTEKYRKLAIGLSVFLRKEVVVMPIGFNITNIDNYTLPDMFVDRRVEFERIMAEMKQINDRIRANDNYAPLKRLMEKKETDEKVADRAIIMDKLITLVDGMHRFSNKKSASLEDSYVQSNSNMEINLTSTTEDKMVEEMLEEISNFDDKAYLKDLTITMKQQVENNDFSPEISSILQKNDIVEKIAKEKEAMEQLRKDNPNSIQKMFKFPSMIFSDKEDTDEIDLYHPITAAFRPLTDGTLVYDMRFPITDGEWAENRVGIGFSEEEDMAAVKEVHEMFVSESSENFRAIISEKFKSAAIKDFSMYRMAEIAWNVEKLYKNLAYMEGRRQVDKISKTVFKYFTEDGYGILINAGNRMTADSQIRFKIVARNNMVGPLTMHNLHDQNDDIRETQWLSCSAMDMRTGVKMFRKACAVTTMYLDSFKEGKNKANYDATHLMKSMAVTMPLMCLMEMKRGTSTQNQLNRYIFHSMTAYTSDKVGCMKLICKDPIRSRLDAAIRIFQLNWSIKLDAESLELMKKTRNKMATTDSDYDTFFTTNMFDPDLEVEFAFIMNDIYLSNLFQKEAGFSAHRGKAVVDKMMEEEMAWTQKRHLDEAKGFLSINKMTSTNDMKQTFDKKFCMLMGKTMSLKMKSSEVFKENLMRNMSNSVADTMMMTSSLDAFINVTGVNDESIKEDDSVKKKTSFMTIQERINKAGVSNMMAFISDYDIVLAVFSLFPKAQIGGAREILIQSADLRIPVKFLEEVARAISMSHEKEMLTKGKQKEKIQSDTSLEFLEKVRMSFNSGEEKALKFSLNSDASRWSPSFTMACFLYFLIGLDLPNNIKDLLIIVVKSFSSKIMFLPDSLIKKWKKKDMSEMEHEAHMQWTREMAVMNSWAVKVFSGMGQGMFHVFSSIYATAKDDITDKIMTSVAYFNDVKILSNTMLSSDDLTKQILMTSKSFRNFPKAIQVVLHVYEMTNRLANIHTNWKKTALHILLDEFNSYMMSGKRAVLAVLKDIFTAMEIVDFTEPYMAVSNVVSNIARAFLNGAYLTTCEVMMELERDYLMEVYRWTPERISLLMDTLCCEESEIPITFGIINMSHMMVQFTHGVDFLDHLPTNSLALSKFRKGMFTGVKDSVLEMEEEALMKANMGRFRIRLPERMDKRMQSMIKEYMQENELEKDEILDMMNKYAFYKEYTLNDPLMMKIYSSSYFIGTKRNYEFGIIMQQQSLVRALQMQSEDIIIKPGIEEETSVWDFIEKMMERSEEKSIYDTLIMEKEVAEMALKFGTMLDDIYMTDSMRHNSRRVLSMPMNSSISSCSKKMLMDQLVGDTKKISNRMQRAVTEIYKILDISEESMMMDPFGTIKKKFSFTQRPFLAFTDYLETVLKNTKFTSVEIMVSGSDKGATILNLMMIYCERKDPSILYTFKNNVTASEETNEFITRMSLGISVKREDNSELFSRFAKMEDAEKIKMTDTASVRAMKVMYNSTKDNYIDLMESDRIFFNTRDTSGNKTVMVHSNMTTTIVSIYTDKTMWVEISVNDEENILFDKVYINWEAELRMMNMKNRKLLYLSDGTFSKELATNLRTIKLKQEMVYRMTGWMMVVQTWSKITVRMNVLDISFTMAKSDYQIIPSSLSNIEDSLLVTEVLSLMNCEMSLSQIGDFLNKRDLFTLAYTERATEVRAGGEVSVSEIDVRKNELETIHDLEAALNSAMLEDDSEDEDTWEEIAIKEARDERMAREGITGMEELANEDLAEMSEAMSRQTAEVSVKTDPLRTIYFSKVLSKAINKAIGTELNIMWRNIKMLKDVVMEDGTTKIFWNSIYTDVFHSCIGVNKEMVVKIFKHIETYIFTRMKISPVSKVELMDDYNMATYQCILISRALNYSDIRKKFFKKD